MHRRMESELPRREPREHDISRSAGNSGRFNRKRPSMLSEFHGSKYHTHNAREGERDGDIQHYRHNRYVDDSLGGLAASEHVHVFQPSAFHSKMSKSDSRSRHPHRHSSQHRSASHHHHNSHPHGFSDSLNEEEHPVKRPRMMVDSSWKNLEHVDHLNHVESVNSSLEGGSEGLVNVGSPGITSPMDSGGLSAYHLEDIDSDDDDSFLREENDKKLSKSPTPVHMDSVSTNGGDRPKATRDTAPITSAMPSKEELLMMMDKVDRDIAAVETQISALQKKQAELEETAKAVANATPRSGASLSSSQSSSGLLELEEEQIREDLGSIAAPSPPSPKRSHIETILSENRNKARSARAVLSALNFPPVPGASVLYHQPCDVPSYQDNIARYKTFRSSLVQLLLKRRIEKYEKEMELCEDFDNQLTKWEKSVERIENNPKKRVRDIKNRELFEKYFPELKTRREQQERLTRVDQRGFGVVRSDAELKEIMCELYEQDEAPVRHRRTHAAVPPMLVEERERNLRYDNKNGLIADPMALHRESCFMYMWSDEEKATFRDKYMFNPKDFETISSFLPNKSPADCVLYYYLSKKREKFKHLVRKANFKRKKAYIKTSDLVNPSMVPSSLNHPLPLSLFASAKPKADTLASLELEREKEPILQPEYGEWSSEEISCLKEGLQKFGRAWGKIYRVVGGLKTATQCKQFYDKFCTDSKLGLTQALAEHSSMKNAEKLRRKVDSRKQEPSSLEVEREKSRLKSATPEEQQAGSQEGTVEELDSENTESAYEMDSKSGDESGSESTITDSCPEDSSTLAGSSSSTQLKSMRGSKKPKPNDSGSGFKRSSEEALDLFISAAEALNNIVPPEVALHDHNYALPPTSITGSMDGLSLIAAAAAVVSPTLSRSAGGNRVPSLSPVRAPRGRPPNSQRKGAGSTMSKLAPTLLSPAGSSNSVLLTDAKAGPLRARTRSAPSDRPKLSTFHVSRPSSTLARMSLNSNSRPAVGRGGGGSGGGGSSTALGPPTTYARHRTDSTSSPSLKSMIAFQPSSSSSTSSQNSVTTTTPVSSSSSSISAFEALVNVAAAAHPAELPQSSISASLQLTSSQANAVSKLSSFSVATPSTLSFTATNLPSSQPAVTLSVTAANSNASNSTGTTTAFLDINQTINLLVSLAQQPVVSVSSNTSQPIPMLSNQRILAPVNLLGNLVMQSSKTSTSNGGSLASSTVSTSRGSRTLSSALSDTLLSHLTSNINTQANSAGRSSQGKGSALKSKKPATAKSDSSSVTTTRSNSVCSSSISKESNGKESATAVNRSASTPAASKSGEDTSNLDLLSSYVAAVAASSQASSLHSTSVSSAPRAIIDLPSNLNWNTTDESATPPSTSDSGQVSETLSTTLLSNSTSSRMHGENESSVSPQNTNEPRQKQHQGKKVEESGLSVEMPSNLSGSSPSLILSDPADDLPRSVVRSSVRCTDPSVEDQVSFPTRQMPVDTSISSSSEGDMTASLASIIPSYSPSVGTQSLLLYTRSLSFPMNSESSTEEEDHLASATRGISELSKLLGTDTDAASKTKQDSPIYKDSTGKWNPSDLLNSSTSLTTKNGTSTSEDYVESPESSGSYLSSVLESQIHGTVHHTSLSTSLNTTTTSNVTDMESTLDLDHSR